MYLREHTKPYKSLETLKAELPKDIDDTTIQKALTDLGVESFEIVDFDWWKKIALLESGDLSFGSDETATNLYLCFRSQVVEPESGRWMNYSLLRLVETTTDTGTTSAIEWKNLNDRTVEQEFVERHEQLAEALLTVKFEAGKVLLNEHKKRFDLFNTVDGLIDMIASSEHGMLLFMGENDCPF